MDSRITICALGICYLEQKGVAAVKLDATPTGKQLYQTIGFADEYSLERRQGMGEPIAAPADPPILADPTALSHLMDRLCGIAP
jgi:hypothetical protein